jgi:hypothetical protein
MLSNNGSAGAPSAKGGREGKKRGVEPTSISHRGKPVTSEWVRLI